MIVTAFIDNNMGLMFNHRRQSQDRVAMENLKVLTGGRIYMSDYSYDLFGFGMTGVGNAGPGDYCLVEDEDPDFSRCEGIVLYRWNRDYPGDRKLSLPMENYILTESVDFEGSSHKKITREIYEKKK